MRCDYIIVLVLVRVAILFELCKNYFNNLKIYRIMKAKQIIETILDNCLDNSKCGFVTFDKDEDLREQVERIFGHPTCYCSLMSDVEYLWYWPGGQAENVFVYADAGISIEVDGEIDQIYLMKVE